MRGYNEVKDEILNWRNGKRKERPYIKSPFYIKKSQKQENNWWYQGAYDAYRESQMNGEI